MDQAGWAAFSDCLDKALELTGAELDAWIAQTAERDPILARQIQDALNARDCASFPDFLSSPVSLPAVATTLCGRRIGPYVVEAEIGRGGMGSVWRARRDDGQYEAVVAIKVIHAAWVGKSGEQSFRQEGNMLGRLAHPNIARLLDAGFFDGTQPYLVLEYVEGESIDVHCAREKLGVEARVELFLHVLAAVAHAHSHLIIHRDLKPSNILVARDGSVKLLDFGVAKLLGEDRKPGTLTHSTVAALTPLYAAPEQLSAEAVTTATDVYSLGLVLYVLLTGVHPFQAMASVHAELVTAVIGRTPARASDVAQQVLIPAHCLEGDLDNILHKALKKDPRERYATAGAFAEDLRRYLTNQPVTAVPDTLVYRASKFVRRNRGAVAGTALAALGLLVTTGFALWQTHRARVERDSAIAAQARADSVSGFTSLLLRDIGPVTAPNALHEHLDRSRTLLRTQHYQDPLVNAILLRQLAARYGEAGDTVAAVSLLEEAITAMAGVDEPESVAQLHCSLANAYEGLGRIDDADRHIRAALDTMERLGDAVRLENRAECRVVESYIATAHGQNRRAIAAARTALAELEEGGIRAGDQHITAQNALRRALAHAGLNAQALQLGTAITAEDTAAGVSQSIWGWIHFFNVASTLRDGGQLLDAQVQAARLLAANNGFSDSGENLRDIALLQSQILLGLNRAAEAKPLLERARRQDGVNPNVDLRVVLTQAEERLQADDLLGAGTLLSVVAAPIDTAIRTHANEGVVALRVRAELALEAGDLGAADAAAAQAMALAVDADGERATGYRESAMLRGDVALRRSNPDAALQFAELALAQARREASSPASSAWIGAALLLRARCENALGNPRLAREDARLAGDQLEGNLGATHPLTQQARALSRD